MKSAISFRAGQLSKQGENQDSCRENMKEKINPYFQPLYNALEDMIPIAKLKEYIENKVIRIAPLAFIAGGQNIVSHKPVQRICGGLRKRKNR